jgi:hypothetical protein
MIPPGGSFMTATMTLDAGHYRVNWQALNAQTEKHKTFWVDACEADEVEEVQPEEQPEENPEENPEEQVEESLEESPPEEQTEESLQEDTDTEQPADPDGGLAPSITDEPLVDELPDTAMEAPILPGLGAALGVLLLVIAHRAIVDRERRSARRR